MPAASGEIRALIQELYLQDLVLSIYRVFSGRLADPEGRAIVDRYLRAEEQRRLRIERHLAPLGARPARLVRLLFTGGGALYGRVASRLGTRVMLRIVLSASRRAARRACSSLENSRPDLIYLATLRARNEGDLHESLTQHLIDTRPRPG
jgi:hypothetical protein